MPENAPDGGGIRHKLKKIGAIFTAPISTKEEEARRELMTRVIMLILAGILLFSTVLVLVGWLAGFFFFEDLAIMLGIIVLMIAGWLLIHWGHWYITRFMPLLLFLALGVYGSLTGGLLSTFILAYLIAILLSAMLMWDRLTWFLVGFVILLHLLMGQLHDQLWADEFLVRAIPFSSLIIVAAALFQFAMQRLQIALAAARQSADQLRSEIIVRELAQGELLQRNRELFLLNRMIAATTSSLEIAQILQIALQELATGLGVSQAGAALLHNDRAHLEVVAAYPLETAASALGVLIPIDGNISTQFVLENREALAIADAQHDPRIAPIHEPLRERGVVSILILPLIVRDQVLGTIGLDSSVRREFSVQEIALASNAAMTVAQAIENAQLYAKVQRLAIHDELTDLLNRRGFFEFGQHEFDRARRFERGLTLIFIDVDNFREVNERFGHGGGDMFLRNLGMLINENVRDIDLVGRYGGDEFIILLTETGLTAGLDVADRLRAIIQNTPVSIGTLNFQVTVSMGLAELTPEITELPELVSIADKALYRAKKSGRNQVIVSDQNWPSR